MDTRRVTRSMTRAQREREMNQDKLEDEQLQPAKKHKVASSQLPVATFADNAVFQSGQYQMHYSQSSENKDKHAHVLLSSDQTDAVVDYVIHKQLGAGSYGMVYEFVANGEKIAVKTPNDKWLASDMGEEKDITSEFHFLRRAYPNEGPYMLQHMYKNKGMTYSYRMMMPYVPGERLKVVIDDVKKPELIALLFLRVMEELNRIHMKGILHGDIRPGNVLVARVGDDFDVHFLDFAFAYDSYDIATSFHEVDRYQFIAPERCHKTSLAHPSQDVYSLARTFEYELNLANVGDANYKKLHEKFPAIEKFVAGGLQHSPIKRPTLPDTIADLKNQYNTYVKASSAARKRNGFFSPKEDKHHSIDNAAIVERNTYTKTINY